jgi:protein kinase D
LFQSDTGSKYYKEIPLSEILAIETAKTPHARKCLILKLIYILLHIILIFSLFFFLEIMHCFELRTANIDYYVGEDLLYGTERGQIPSSKNGVGAHLARSWETSIRQALMPVTSASSSLYND